MDYSPIDHGSSLPRRISVCQSSLASRGPVIEPISNAAFVSNWRDIRPFLDITDAELEFQDEQPLSFFEALTLLAFAAFADAPVDVVVLEVGMGGEWDSTNVADGQVAVFTPISLDHTRRLGNTVAEIAQSGFARGGLPLDPAVSADPCAVYLVTVTSAAREEEASTAVVSSAASASAKSPFGSQATRSSNVLSDGYRPISWTPRASIRTTR